MARALAGAPAFERSRHSRKKIEMLFAHLKRILRLARLRLRGPNGARDEFLLAATAEPEKARQATTYAGLCWDWGMMMCIQPTGTQLQSRSDRANTAIPQL